MSKSAKTSGVIETLDAQAASLGITFPDKAGMIQALDQDPTPPDVGILATPPENMSDDEIEQQLLMFDEFEAYFESVCERRREANTSFLRIEKEVLPVMGREVNRRSEVQRKAQQQNSQVLDRRAKLVAELQRRSGGGLDTSARKAGGGHVGRVAGGLDSTRSARPSGQRRAPFIRTLDVRTSRAAMPVSRERGNAGGEDSTFSPTFSLGATGGGPSKAEATPTAAKQASAGTSKRRTGGGNPLAIPVDSPDEADQIGGSAGEA